MKRRMISLFGVVLLLFLALPIDILAAPPPDVPPGFSDFSPEQILVKFKPGTSLSEAAEIHHQLGGQAEESILGIGVQMVKVPKGQVKDRAKAYSANLRVAYAEPNYMAQVVGEPDDAYFYTQWGMQKIQAPGAWDTTIGSRDVVIAILDTGVDLDHPDLTNKIVSSINFSGSPTMDDVYGHGTHVAGIAAASTNNEIGVAGMGCDSSIMNVKVLGDTGGGAYSAIAAGIIWAADNGAQIINMSLGGWSSSQTLEDAVNYAWNKGVTVVAAAGNLGSTAPIYPAYYTNCIAVAGTDADDAKASWSNHGDWVDVAAPGASIYSTLRNGSYGYMSGTSMASPHVAGLAALVLTTVSDTNGNGYLNDEVRSKIESTCDDIGLAGIGHGRINAARAVGSVPVAPGMILGQVTDSEDSSLIVGATVTDGTRTALTDAAGQYSISDVPPGSYQVAASKEGYETFSLAVSVSSEGTSEADFSLSAVIVPGGITGTLATAKDGSVIAGATVTDGTRTTSTDATGKYTIANVPPGTYQVTASKAGYQNSSVTVTVVAGNTVVANFSLSETPGAITGTVTSAKDGSVIAGATVTDRTRTTTTDTTGKYTIANVPPSTYQVSASKAGYYSSSSSVTVLAGATAVANFSLNEIIVPGSISGTVTSANDGSAIAGATVTDGTRTTTTDATGRYTIANVPPGTYQVTASKAGYHSSTVTVTVLAGSTVVANFSLNEVIVPGSITGTVTSAKDGSPTVGATVSDGTRTTSTDATGKYTIANVPPGAYQVTAGKAGYQNSSVTVTVVAGNTVVVDFSLNEIPGAITGTVTSAKDGSPVVGATVTDGTRTTSTDATGRYTIANVPPGTYQVTTSKSGYHSSSLTVAVLSGGTVVANFLLNEVILPGSIAGSVTSAKDGSAIVGATVTDGTRMTTTDATGKYAISNVPPGTYQVIASKAGYYSFSSSVTVVAGSTTVANFALAEIPGSIAGTVTSAKDGSPLVGATVTDGTRTTTTDGTGKYTIANVPPGTYQVTASKAGYQSSSVTVMVVAGNTVVANFSLSETPGAITGTLTSAKDGSVIAGATVTDGTRTTTTDATGKYTISNVPPGTYQAVASKSGYHSSSLSVTVLAGSTAVANFALNEVIVPGSISGTVTSAKDGSAIAGATVTDGTRPTTTDAMGKYTISNVMPGTYQVTANKEGYVSVTSAVTVVSGGTVTINFSLSPRTPAMWVDSIGFIKSGKNLFIQVRVVTASGVVPGATVGLSLECTSGGVWSFSSTTDTAGLVKFKLSKAPIGNYLTAVNSLTRSGFLWDTSKGTTATGYALSG